MNDPYREETTRRHEALLAEERALLVRAGKVMVYAGAVGLIAVLVGLKAASTEGAVVLIRSTVLPGLFSALTLQAGLVLARLPGGGRDYHEIETAVRSLGVVYAIKGVIVLIIVAVYASLVLMTFALAFLG